MAKRNRRTGFEQPPAPAAGRAPQPPRHVVGHTAEASPGQGSTTTPSSSWLAEREVARGGPPEGVPVETAPRKPPQVLESRRGKHRSG